MFEAESPYSIIMQYLHLPFYKHVLVDSPFSIFPDVLRLFPLPTSVNGVLPTEAMLACKDLAQHFGLD